MAPITLAVPAALQQLHRWRWCCYQCHLPAAVAAAAAVPRQTSARLAEQGREVAAGSATCTEQNRLLCSGKLASPAQRQAFCRITQQSNGIMSRLTGAAATHGGNICVELLDQTTVPSQRLWRLYLVVALDLLDDTPASCRRVIVRSSAQGGRKPAYHRRRSLA